MAVPVTTTTEEDGVIFQFLKAAEERIEAYDNRQPFNKKDGKLVIGWMRALVGNICEDGSLQKPR